MKIGIHQPNLIPWLPFFYKMQQSDTFILLIHCQFEKNGFQNRFNLDEKWITKPVVNAVESILEKRYTDGPKIVDVNVPLIIGFAGLLGIDTRKIHYDHETQNTGTARIIELCRLFDCDEYLTNPDATDKYLDGKLMNDSGIEVVPCELPPQYRISLFRAIEANGIEGCIKIIQKDWSKCKA